MKVIGYCRVSSQEQASEGLSLQMQEEKIRAYCGLHDIELLEVVVDAGISGKDISGRPGLTKALDMIMGGHADGLVSWKLDRCFRSTLDAVTIEKQFSDAKKTMIFISESLDNSTAIGRFFFRTLSSLAELEREMVAERTKSVLASKRQRGEFVGRPKFGFTPHNKTLVCNAEQQIIIQRVKDMSKTMSFRAIAKTLNTEGIRTNSGKCWTHIQISRIAA